jgi:hypothetical protein
VVLVVVEDKEHKRSTHELKGGGRAWEPPSATGQTVGECSDGAHMHLGVGVV